MRMPAELEKRELSPLIHDIARYYRDHIFTMELMWPREDFGAVTEIVSARPGTMPRGSEFAGTVIPSIDMEAIYVRIRNGAKGPRGRPMDFLAQRIPLEEVSGPFMDLVLRGVFERIAWAFMKKIWAEVDAKATHYELSRNDISGLVRRARLKTLLDFISELVLMEVAPCLKGYFYSSEIGALFVEKLTKSILDVEYPDESKGLEGLKERLFETLYLAEKVDFQGGGCLGG